MGGLEKRIKSNDYHDYVIKDGRFIGAFEEMYRNIDDPWHHGDATASQYDLALYLIARFRICGGGGLILDIGCGKGAFAARLKQQMPKAHIVGVDISPTAIGNAKQKYGYLDIEFKVMDIQKEYINITEKFDLIVMSQLMWYTLPSFREIVNNLGQRVLKNDGYLLINQCFYRPEEQKYGKEIVSTVEDMLNLVNLEVLEMVELNRLVNHNAIVLFKNRPSKIQGSGNQHSSQQDRR